MLHPRQWIETRKQGLYCIPGDFYIDPMYAVERALVTHGHGDHARSGHQHVMATPATLAIMRTRYGEQFCQAEQAAEYGQTLTHHQVEITFYPAGHILGSAQILLAYKGSRLVISGDYKRAPDPTCPLFTPIACDVFISEATFGLPVFKHPPIAQEIEKVMQSLQHFPERCHLIGAYALGKCQRVILALRAAGYEKPIYIHGAMQKLCQLYQDFGFDLGELIPATTAVGKDLQGEVVISPPSALHDRWSRRLPNVLTINASGWMQIRAHAKQKGIDLPLIISDHADWYELTQTFHDVNAPEIWITHGKEEALVYYAQQHGFKSQALSLIGYDDEEES